MDYGFRNLRKTAKSISPTIDDSVRLSESKDVCYRTLFRIGLSKSKRMRLLTKKQEARLAILNIARPEHILLIGMNKEGRK